MGRSCRFYSRLPGFRLVYGGSASSFSTFEVGKGSKVYLNLELEEPKPDDGSVQSGGIKRVADFGRVIFHTRDVDAIYQLMKQDRNISQAAIIENEPIDAPWGERYFHLREPDGYQLSFAQPIKS